jgi:hypothetical protein
MKGDRLLSLLQGDMQGLIRAAASLEKSLTKCADLAPSPRQSFEEEEGFDALTSRFARAADILTQKVLKTVVLILREDAPTFIDRMNLCEKIGAIPSAAALIEVRDLRNTIAHEYATDDLVEIYADTVKLAPILLGAVSCSISFAKERFPEIYA